MRELLMAGLLFCFSSVVSASAPTLTTTLNLQPGGVQSIQLADTADTLAVGNPTVIDARISERNELLVIGKKEGYSELILWGVEGQLIKFEITVENSVDHSTINTELNTSKQVLELEVHVVEIKSRTLRESGIQWSGSMQGPEAGILEGRPFLNLDTNLSSSLRLIQEQGEGRILATPVLRVEDGRSAEFVVGGEVPLPQTSLQGVGNVDFRRYGVVLEVTPEITSDGQIRTTVFSELSNLDAAVSVQGIPGLLTRQTSSTVTVEPGHTLILSGLISEHVFSSISQSSLSSSVEEQTELVVFITPELMANRKQRQRERSRLKHKLDNHMSGAGCQGMIELGYGGF